MKIPEMRRHFLKIAALVSVSWALLTAFSENGLRGYLRQLGEKRRVEKVIAELAEKNRSLAEMADRLDNDMRYVEWLVREELGFVKPDEVIFRIEE